MEFSFSFKSSLLLIFFFHGIVFSTLLAFKSVQNEDKSAAWLAAFTFLASLYISPFMFGYAGWYQYAGYREFLFFMPLQQLLLIGPVIYFYTRSSLDKSFQLSKQDLKHLFLPLIYAVYSLIVFIGDVFVLDQYYFYADGRDKDLDLWYQVAGLISMSVYLVLSIKFYRSYRLFTLDRVSFADEIRLGWIPKFLATFLIVLLLRVVFFVTNPEWGEFGTKFWYYLTFSVLFYYISVNGYSNSVNPMIDMSETRERSEEEIPENPKGSQTDREESEELVTKIRSLMDSQKPHLNPDLTLQDVAEALGLTRKRTSRAINAGFKTNFNDFVNRYRTKEVIKKLEEGEAETKTLLAIAFESGFNSKSTFNRAFKKETEKSPKDFISELKSGLKS